MATLIFDREFKEAEVSVIGAFTRRIEGLQLYYAHHKAFIFSNKKMPVLMKGVSHERKLCIYVRGNSVEVIIYPPLSVIPFGVYHGDQYITGIVDSSYYDVFYTNLEETIEGLEKAGINRYIKLSNFQRNLKVDEVAEIVGAIF